MVMQVSESLSIPAYLLVPAKDTHPGAAVMAIQGHGEVEPLIGVRDEPHHMFALELARAGYLTLAPALRGFGVLSNLARGRDGYRLDYWPQQKYRQFTLATDSFLKGKPLIGTTVEDLLRWEDWLGRDMGIKALHSVGLSYGGDLAWLYPVFSSRVNRIFASGTLGSFAPIFERCYNAPAHCIPGVLEWMDRSDIAGLNAPRPIALHYGELDTPSPTNASAAYNETVPAAATELKAIYARANSEVQVKLLVSKGKGHEMDIAAMLEFLA
jgi:dienelactone hydrolase